LATSVVKFAGRIAGLPGGLRNRVAQSQSHIVSLFGQPGRHHRDLLFAGIKRQGHLGQSLAST
jgi:hypothetical protein